MAQASISGGPLRVAIIGPGQIAHQHLEAFQLHPERLQLAAACNRSPERARTLATKLPYDVPIFSDWRDMLAAVELDGAVIALSHDLHFPAAMDCIARGVPLLIEKPVTCNLDQTRRVRDAAAARGVGVMVGQIFRSNREAIWLRRWMGEAMNFGQLRSFDLCAWQNVHGYTGGPQNISAWILDGEQAGGGVVVSLAIHGLDLVRFLSGCDFVEATARGRFDPPFRNGAESSCSALLTMSNGASGTLHASYTTPRCPYSADVNLFGDYGAVTQWPEAIGQYHGPFRYSTTRGQATTQWGQMYSGFQRVPEETVDGYGEHPFVNQMLAFEQSIRAGATPPSDIGENFNTMACVQAIYDSLRSGKTEKVAGE